MGTRVLINIEWDSVIKFPCFNFKYFAVVILLFLFVKQSRSGMVFYQKIQFWESTAVLEPLLPCRPLVQLPGFTSTLTSLSRTKDSTLHTQHHQVGNPSYLTRHRVMAFSIYSSFLCEESSAGMIQVAQLVLNSIQIELQYFIDSQGIASLLQCALKALQQKHLSFIAAVGC